MEGGGRQTHLLGRLLSKLRGEHKYPTAGRPTSSHTSTGISGVGLYSRASESTACGSSYDVYEDLYTQGTSTSPFDAQQFAANIDLRYGGQYLTPEQLPEFCNQLHNLVEVIRNIQSFARVTGEYPSEMERRLEAEAREVGALCAEARHALHALARTRTQQHALQHQRAHLLHQLHTLKDTEIRELESTIRLSDRKLFKNWEALKESTDPAAFEPLLEEIRNKQAALEGLSRLVAARRAGLRAAPAHPLPPPLPRDSNGVMSAEAVRGAGGRRGCKRRRREPPRRAPPDTPPALPADQECTSRYRVGSNGAVTLTPMELPSRGSVRDIVFFTIT